MTGMAPGSLTGDSDDDDRPRVARPTPLAAHPGRGSVRSGPGDHLGARLGLAGAMGLARPVRAATDERDRHLSIARPAGAFRPTAGPARRPRAPDRPWHP